MSAATKSRLLVLLSAVWLLGGGCALQGSYTTYATPPPAPGPSDIERRVILIGDAGYKSCTARKAGGLVKAPRGGLLSHERA